MSRPRWRRLAVGPAVLAVLLAVGCALGFTLHHAAFGFAGAYRRAAARLRDAGVAGVLGAVENDAPAVDE